LKGGWHDFVGIHMNCPGSALISSKIFVFLAMISVELSQSHLSIPTYLLTPWSRVLLEKLTGSAAYLLTYLLHGAESFLRS